MCFGQNLEAGEDALPVPAQNNSPLEGKDSSQGVFVRDSATVLEKFTLAERMERLRDWDNAADVYQSVVREFADRVVPSRTDDENNITQYRSVVPAIQERIARWPAEGLDVFRQLYGDDAARLLDRALTEPDPDQQRRQLARVVNEYFVTDSAITAARLLVDASFRGGDFASSAALADRMLDNYPGLGDANADFAFRAALAHHLLGDTEAAALRFNELPADAVGTLGGEDVNYRAALSDILIDAPPVPTSSTTTDWPTAFGAPSRAVIPAEPTSDKLQRAFRVELIDSTPRTTQPAQVQRFRKDIEALTDLGEFAGIVPVIDRGELFFHDNATLHAVSMIS
ncbi:MAG: tetratricopeptide repeat protein, partial [Planctomycetota bacterium]